MKTKELIEQLQLEDPTGELEVCMGNEPIVGAHTLPAYYDGCPFSLLRDDKGNLVGIKRTSNGYIVSITSYDISDLLLDYPKLKIEYETDYAKKHYFERDEKTRQKMKDILDECELDTFTDWVYGRSKAIKSDKNNEIIKKFWLANYTSETPIPEHIDKPITKNGVTSYGSWNDRRWAQYDEQVKIKLQNGLVELRLI